MKFVDRELEEKTIIYFRENVSEKQSRSLCTELLMYELFGQKKNIHHKYIQGWSLPPK